MEWIKVEDDTPDDFRQVLLRVSRPQGDHLGYSSGHYGAFTKEWVIDYDRDSSDRNSIVTHWKEIETLEN